MDYFTVGSGNFVDQKRFPYSIVPEASVKYFNADMLEFGGFAHVQVATDAMTLTFMDGIGVDRYQYSIRPRK